MCHYLAKKTIEKLKEERKKILDRRLARLNERLEYLVIDGGECVEVEINAAMAEKENLMERVSEIEKVLRDCAPVEGGKKDEVGLGAKIGILINGIRKKIVIVDSVEADPIEGKISYSSPLGMALMGARLGYEGNLVLDTGKSLDYEIYEIE